MFVCTLGANQFSRLLHKKKCVNFSDFWGNSKYCNLLLFTEPMNWQTSKAKSSLVYQLVQPNYPIKICFHEHESIIIVCTSPPFIKGGDWPSQKLQEGGGLKILGEKGVVSKKEESFWKGGEVNPKKLNFWNSKCLKH